MYSSRADERRTTLGTRALRAFGTRRALDLRHALVVRVRSGTIGCTKKNNRIPIRIDKVMRALRAFG